MTKIVRSPYRGDIQVLRGISILAVVLFHLPDTWFKSGYLGVDVFFVISGFLICPKILKIFTDDNNSLKKISRGVNLFAKARVRRLAPAFGVSSILLIPLLVIFGDTALSQRVLSQSLAGLLLVGNLGAYKFSGDYFHPNLANPLIHYWSLSVEEQIYICLPVLFLFIYLVRRNITQAMGRYVVVFCMILSACIFFMPSTVEFFYRTFAAVPSDFAFYSPLGRFWEFASGGLISFFQIRRIKVLKNRYFHFLLVGLLLGIVFLPLFDSEQMSTLLAIFLTFAIISVQSMKVLPSQISKYFALLGDRSYSIYLVHLPIIYLLVESPLIIDNLGDFRLALCILSIFTSFFIGSYLYKHVELRFYPRDRVHLPSQSRFAIPGLLVSPLVISCVLLFLVSNSFYGLIPNSDSRNPGVLFKSDCARIDFAHQFPCKLSNFPSGPRVALLGDSHASQYALVLKQLSSEMNFNLIMLGSVGEALDSSRTLSALQDFNPDVLVISKLWDPPDFKEGSSFMSAQKLFDQYSRKVIIVGQNPSFITSGSSSGTSIIQYIFGFRKTENTLSRPWKLSKDSVETGKLVQEWTKSHSYVFIDPVDFLCKNGLCDDLSPETGLYFDNNHLSTIGAQGSTPIFRSLFFKYLGSIS